jgi:L-rhamnose isomerase
MQCQYDSEGDYTLRLALLEDAKGLPFGAVWNYYCTQQDVPVGINFMDEIKSYESQTLTKRG